MKESDFSKMQGYYISSDDIHWDNEPTDKDFDRYRKELENMNKQTYTISGTFGKIIKYAKPLSPKEYGQKRMGYNKSRGRRK